MQEAMLSPRPKPSFPSRAIEHCLQTGTIELEHLNLIAFCDAPARQAKNMFSTALAQAPFAQKAFVDQGMAWLQQQLWIKKTIFNRTGFQGQILVSGRQESLAASTFFPSKFNEAALFTMAGSAESTATGYGLGTYNSISTLAEQPFPHALDFFYSAFNRHLGLEKDDEKQFLQLAAQGQPRYTKHILSELMDLKQDGSFKLNMRSFSWNNGLRLTAYTAHDFPGNADADTARSIQEVITQVLLQSLRYLHQETGQTKICIAGGSALLCTDLKAILEKSGFREHYIQINEGGGAPGAALLAWHSYLEAR
jgi:carbamoyltransferase